MKQSLDLFQKTLSTIYDESFKNKHRLSPKFFTRKRRISFAAVIATLLQMAKKSLQIECNFLFPDPDDEPLSKQAFSQARYKIGVSAFQELHQQLIEAYYTGNNERLWKGYRTFAGDGSLYKCQKKKVLRSILADGIKRKFLLLGYLNIRMSFQM